MTAGTGNVSRRNVIKAAAAAGIITPAFAGLTASTAAASVTPKLGQIAINKRPGVTIHTYVAPAKSAVVTSHILETDKGLYMIDSQFLQMGGGELKAYVDSLGKPLQRIMLSHPHPDHFSGYAANFKGVDFVTTAKVAEVMDQRWIKSGRVKELQERFGDQAAKEFVKPQSALSVGNSDLDGVPMEIAMYENAESLVQNTFYFPEAKVLVVQDLAYSNAHHFPLGNNPAWIELLKKLRAETKAELILCGHGLPAGKGVFDDSIKYLTLLNTLLTSEKSAKPVIDKLAAAYPSYAAQGITKFIHRIYKKKK